MAVYAGPLILKRADVEHDGEVVARIGRRLRAPPMCKVCQALDRDPNGPGVRRIEVGGHGVRRQPQPPQLGLLAGGRLLEGYVGVAQLLHVAGVGAVQLKLDLKLTRSTPHLGVSCSGAQPEDAECVAGV